MAALGTLRKLISDARLSPDARRIRAERLTYLSPAKLERLERALGRAIGATPRGDVLEFGVALGGSAILLAKRARRAGRRFAGFDVFGMIPPPTSEKDDQVSRDRYAAIAAGQSRGIGGDEYYGYRDDLYTEVRRTFAAHGLPPDEDSVMLVKGLFEETWPRFRSEGVAFAHIDCDWYDPVHYCLKSLADGVLPGGVIVLDDYNDYGGCRTAVDEFTKTRPDFRFEAGPNPMLWRVGGS